MLTLVFWLLRPQQHNKISNQLITTILVVLVRIKQLQNVLWVVVIWLNLLWRYFLATTDHNKKTT